VFGPVVKLLGKMWWIPTGARLEGPKLEPEGPRAEVGKALSLAFMAFK